MPFSIILSPEEPILFVRISTPFSIKDDLPQFMAQFRQVYDASPVPLWNMTDTRNLQIPFGDVLAGMAAMTRGDSAALLHPNAAGYAMLADSEIFRLAGNALSQAQYGGIKARVFTTEDEALAYLRAQIAKSG